MRNVNILTLTCASQAKVGFRLTMRNINIEANTPINRIGLVLD